MNSNYAQIPCDIGIGVTMLPVDCNSNNLQICFTYNSETPSSCGNPILQLSYPNFTFVYSNLGNATTGANFVQVSPPLANTTILQHHLILVTVPGAQVCIEGRVTGPVVPMMQVTFITGMGTNLFTNSFPIAPPIIIGGGAGNSQLLSSLIGNVLPPFGTTQAIAIDGTLIIDTDYSFLGYPLIGGIRSGGGIFMHPNAKIEIQSGKILEIRANRIQGCADKWDRILVQSDATLNMFLTRVKDADVAIEVRNRSNCSLSNNIFNYNNTALGAYGVNRKSINFIFGPITIANGMYGFDFEYADIIPSPFRPYFQNLENGIRLKNTSLELSRATFQNCRFGINVTQLSGLLSVKDCMFNDGFTAVQTKGNVNFIMEDCSVRGYETAIRRGNAFINEISTIRNNNFVTDGAAVIVSARYPSYGSMTNNGILSGGNNVYAYGFSSNNNDWNFQANGFGSTGFSTSNIHLQGFSGANIFQNKVMASNFENIRISGARDVLVYGNEGIGKSTNIFLDGAAESRINCNNWTSAVTATTLLGACDGTMLFGNNQSSSMFNLSYGLPNSSSSSNYASTGRQDFRGNLFDGSSPSNRKARNASSSTLASRSQFLVGSHPLNPSILQGGKNYPYFISSFDEWFSPEQQFDYSCSLNMEDDPKEQALAHLIEVKSNDALEGYNENVHFIFDYKTLLLLSETESIRPLTDTEIYWKQQLLQTEVAPFVAFSTLWDELTLPVSVAQAVDILQDAVKGAYLDLEHVNQMSPDSTASQDEWDTFFDTKQVELDNISVLIDSLEVLHQQWSANNASRVTLLQQGVDNLPTSVPAMDYLKSAWMAKIAYVFQLDNYGPTVNKLYDIAQQCTMEGGEGTQLARTLLMMKSENDEQYTFFDACMEDRSSASTPQYDEQLASDLLIYPNPGSEQITIQSDNGDALGWIKIMHSTGKVADIVLAPNDRLELSITSWMPGIYFIQTSTGVHKFIKL